MTKITGKSAIIINIFFLLSLILIGCEDIYSDDYLYSIGGKSSALDLDGHILLQLDRKGFMAHHEGWIYTLENGLYRMQLDGTGKHKIGNRPFSNSVYHNDWLYFMDEAGAIRIGWTTTIYAGSIYRMRLDGSEYMKYTATDNVVNFILKDNWIYYQSINNNWDDRSLYRINIDGSDKHLIAENSREYIISDDYIFIKHEIKQFDTKIIRYNLDGTGKIIIVEDDTVILTPLFTDNDNIYFMVWFDSLGLGGFKGPQIHRVLFDGTEKNIIINNHENYSIGISNFKDGFIYFVFSQAARWDNDWVGFSTINKIRADGTDITKLLDSRERNFNRLGMIGNHFYFMSGSNIFRISVNGGNIDTVGVLNDFTWDSPRYVSAWFLSQDIFYVIEEPLL